MQKYMRLVWSSSERITVLFPKHLFLWELLCLPDNTAVSQNGLHFDCGPNNSSKDDCFTFVYQDKNGWHCGCVFCIHLLHDYQSFGNDVSWLKSTHLFFKNVTFSKVNGLVSGTWANLEKTFFVSLEPPLIFNYPTKKAKLQWMCNTIFFLLFFQQTL